MAAGLSKTTVGSAGSNGGSGDDDDDDDDEARLVFVGSMNGDSTMARSPGQGYQAS